MKRKRFLLVSDRTDSIDSLTRVLRLSGHVVLTGAAAEQALNGDPMLTECWEQPAPERRALKLLNWIELLTYCLALEGVTAHERRQWTRQLGASRMGLEALFAGGLDRDFLSGTTGPSLRAT